MGQKTTRRFRRLVLVVTSGKPRKNAYSYCYWSNGYIHRYAEEAVANLLSLGILGREIVHALGEDSSKWTTVHALSRSQKEKYPSNVKHDTIDLTGDSKQMAEQLKGVEGEVLFFAAYLQKDSEQENWDVNGRTI